MRAAKNRTFTSDVSIMLFEGGETEFSLIVKYEVTPEQKQTWDEPGRGAAVDITDITLVSSTLQPLITPSWFDAMVRADESFANSLIADWQDADLADADDAADRRREELAVKP